MRFLLIDKITELVPHKTISAVKNLTLAEEYLADHFPGFPVMPGVLMLESLVQAGGWLVRHSEDFAHSVVLLKEVRAIRYNNFVSPGNVLQVQMNLKKNEGSLWDFSGTGTVNNSSAVSARVILEAINLSDRNPALVESDEFRRSSYRDLFRQIWSPPA